ncbi:MAG: thymidine kinase [Bacteroidia bacterium]|nr:thymidine kinase [Bacteroidia bacterium]MDW8332605.1 thymidine kinase [Bacteroidia bacterium]
MDFYAVPPAHGRIEVICGCMFSGKTEELIRRVRQVMLAGQTVKIFKPMMDVRYSQSEVVSHLGTSLPSIAVTHASKILDLSEGVNVVAIDEAQFFGDDLCDVAGRLANRGVRVIVAGLDMDYTGRPFGPMPYLLAIAEYVTKLHAICVRTKEPAHFSFRKIANDSTILLGQSESYEPMSRRAFIEACRERNMAGAKQEELFTPDWNNARFV